MSLSGLVTSLLALGLATLLLPLPPHVTGGGACGNLTCLNGGTCVNVTDNDTCLCPPDFTENDCSTPVDACASSPCVDGTCTSGENNTYSCQCSPGFTGPRCSTVDACASSPCVDGTCTSGENNTYSCQCSPGFTGPRCSTEEGGGSGGDGRGDCVPPCTGSAGKGDFNLAAVIGGCVAAAVIVLVLAIFIVKCRQRRARTRGKRFTRIHTGDNGFSAALEGGSSVAMEMQPLATHESGRPYTRLTPDVLAEVVARTREQPDFLADEFERLPRGLTHPATVALSQHNKAKNRYRGICAYDHSRVVLSVVPGKPHSHYINACFLDGYDTKKAYIAAQGPTDVNVEDFLRMIWEQRVEKVAMLTKPMEMGQMKCLQYWSDEVKYTVTFGAFSVTVVSCQDRADTTVRSLLIQPAGGAARTVTHFLFKSWPDKGVPESPWPLIDFRHKLMTSPSSASAPILVHCSAGVGRTGTLVALDVAVRRLQQDGGVEVPALVASLRDHRVDLVQTLAQYTFLHEAALVGLCCIGRFVPLEDFFCDVIGSDEALAGEEYKLVRECVSPLPPDHCSLGRTPEHRHANRDQHILPCDSRVVWLSQPLQDHVDYVNAVYLPSYTEDRRYVLTQTPLAATVVNFWRAVFEADVRVIVSLDTTTPDLQADVGEFLPVAEPVLQQGPLTLRLLQSQADQAFLHRTILASLEGQGERTVEQCEVNHWPGWQEVPSDPDLMLAVCQAALQWSPPSQGRILVHCRDGSRRSGLYVALSTLLERSRSEAEVAVPYVVGVLASVRPQSLPSQEQYVFLYTAMMQHASQFWRSREERAEEEESPYVNSSQDEPVYVNSSNEEDVYLTPVHEDLYVNAAMLKHA